MSVEAKVSLFHIRCGLQWFAGVTERASDITNSTANAGTGGVAGDAKGRCRATRIIRQINYELDNIAIGEHEQLRHDGVALRISMFGERSPWGMYIDHSDLVKVLGIERTRDCPDVELFQGRTTDGRERTLVNYKGMTRMWALYSCKSDVANALLDWVMETLFSVQYGGAEPMRQAAYDNLVLADRQGRYQASDWMLSGEFPVPCLYMDEVCSAREAADRWPENVEAALECLPEGTDMSQASVVKIGYSIDKKRRIVDLRALMKRTFGECADVRIVALARCPGAKTIRPQTTGRRGSVRVRDPPAPGRRDCARPRARRALRCHPLHCTENGGRIVCGRLKVHANNGRRC